MSFIKILKVSAIISYLFISVEGNHIGGKFWEFLIIGFFLEPLPFLLSSIIVIVLISILISIFNSFYPRDLFILIIGSVFLAIPIILFFSSLVMWTIFPFLFLYSLTICFLIKIKQNKETL